MKAIVYTKYGSPNILQVKDVEKSLPKKNQILVKVHATTVNRTDCAMLRGKPFIMRFATGLFKPKNQVLGTDFAGVIEAKGTSVTKFKVGDQVFGFDDMGISSHAQYLVVSQDNAIGVMPEKLSFEQVAASIEGAHYAYNFVNKVHIKKGEKVLVNGATGAIGSACVQLAKYYGAEVTAVCKVEHAEKIMQLGAVDVIDYTSDDFTRTNKQFDYVFDAVGKSSFAKCKPILKPKGVYMSSELGAWNQNVIFALLTPIFSKKKVKFPLPLNRQKSIDLVVKLSNEGYFKSVIDRKYKLDEIANAYTFVESGQKIGNVVINIE